MSTHVKSQEKKKSRAVRPTRKQKEVISLHRLAPENWMVLRAIPGQMEIVHKKKGTTRLLNC
jgi:hypothetical protein